MNYGILETKDYLSHPNQIIQSSSLKISEKETAEMLKIILREMKTKSRIAIGSTPAFAVFTTMLEMPVPFARRNPEGRGIPSAPVHSAPNERGGSGLGKSEEYDNADRVRYQRIFLIGIPKEIVQRYKAIFRGAGLKLVALEIDGLSIIRALGTEEPTLFVDLGAETSNIFLSESNNLFYSVKLITAAFILHRRSRGVSV